MRRIGGKTAVLTTTHLQLPTHDTPPSDRPPTCFLAHCVAALKGTQDLTNGGESVYRPQSTSNYRMADYQSVTEVNVVDPETDSKWVEPLGPPFEACLYSCFW